MRTLTIRGLCAGLCLVATGLTAQAAKTPTVEEMLAYSPIQKGIVYSTPAAQEYGKCKVEAVQGATKAASGWVLKDAKGLIVRRYTDTNGDQYPDQWAYFRDGLEVYREIDSNFTGKGFNGKVDHYMWLNSAGMKVGLDRNEDGAIDAWEAISVEELSQEVVRALATKDLRILQTLLVSEEDLKALGAPAREITRIGELQKAAPAKFQKLCSKLGNLNETTKWVHLEAQPPSRLPADTTGMKQDVFMYYRAMVLCETGKKSDYIQLAEIVQVGDAWKLLDAPLPADADTVVNVNQPATGGTTSENPELEALFKQLADHDAKCPPMTQAGPHPKLAKHYLERVIILEQIVEKSKDAEREQWQKQIVDSLGTAMQASEAGDTKAADALVRLADRFAKDKLGGDLAGYAAFRVLSTEYSVAVANTRKAEDMLALQTKHVERLAKFVQSYPRAEDAPEALIQLGTIYEVQNKEADARRYYQQLAGTFASTRQGLKAAGALRRLDLVGKPWQVAGPVVCLTGHQFDMIQLRGRVVVAYYYASWCQSAQADLAKLSKIVAPYKNQMDVVAINLDEEQATADPFVRQNQGCWHLFAGGGMDSALAAQYGIIAPPTLFLIGKDGKVISRTVDLTGLEEELKKVVK